MIETQGTLSTEEIIRTRDLTKAFGDHVTVDRLNLTVRRGEIYGFLGPNGAGKTTTIRMILGLLPATAGSVELFGKPVSRDSTDLHRRMGVVGELSFLYDDLSALEYLVFFARLNRRADPVQSSKTLLERLNLSSFENVLARDFSQGMQKKLSLARALLGDPEVLILDEPVSGLDPIGILEVRELLQEKRRAGKTIFISSHILSEVERTADRVGIIHKGQLIVEDTVAAVSDQLAVGIELEIELQVAIPGLEKQLEQISGVQDVQIKDRQLTLHCQREEDMRARVSQAIMNAGGVVVNMSTRRASLEDAFVKLTEQSSTGTPVQAGKK